MPIFTINPVTRKIRGTDYNLGVFNDKNASIATFTMTGEIVKRLRDPKVYINYMREDEPVRQVEASNIKIEDDIIQFEWTPGRSVTSKVGPLKFSVCIMTLDDDKVVDMEWNTTTCTGTILEGLEPELTEEDEDRLIDHYEQLSNRLKDIVDAAEEKLTNTSGRLYTFTTSISMNASASTYGAIFPVNISRSGYKPVGIVGCYASQAQITVNAYLDGGTVKGFYQIETPNNANISFRVTVIVLYEKL